MNILITGAKGFVGRNLTENLKNIRDDKNRTRPNIQIDEIYEYDIDSTAEELDEYCAKADFVLTSRELTARKTLPNSRRGISDLPQLCWIR